MGKFSEILAQSDLFNGLKLVPLNLIDAICEEQTYQKGALIFQENSHQNELYLNIAGMVEILVNPAMVTAQPAPNGPVEPITPHRIGPCLGKIALVDEGLRSTSARAGTNKTHLLSISRTRLLKL
jgi:CRP/FNR family transcriptional regulator, cyclic AMP receptor protein